MNKIPVALQLYSVRDDMKEDFKGTLEKVKEMGYDGIEFAGLFDNDPKDVKKMCEEIGLVPVSAHVSYAEMMEDEDLSRDDVIDFIEYNTIRSLPYIIDHTPLIMVAY